MKAVEFDGPIALGRNIPADEPVTPMINIIEEERRVTIQGYVFDKEVRELRSKRKILILKITDYTSSFSVKSSPIMKKMNKSLRQSPKAAG